MSNPSREKRSNGHVPMNTMYHASLQVNSFLIRQQGLKTSEDERGKGRIWLADATEVNFVISHLMARRRLSVAQWCVWEVRADLLAKWPTKSGRSGIWYVTADIPPHCISILESKWVGFDLDEFPHDDSAVYVYSEPCGRFRPA
jgi:hypothetical protein